MKLHNLAVLYWRIWGLWGLLGNMKYGNKSNAFIATLIILQWRSPFNCFWKSRVAVIKTWYFLVVKDLVRNVMFYAKMCSDHYYLRHFRKQLLFQRPLLVFFLRNCPITAYFDVIRNFRNLRLEPVKYTVTVPFEIILVLLDWRNLVCNFEEGKLGKPLLFLQAEL